MTLWENIVKILDVGCGVAVADLIVCCVTVRCSKTINLPQLHEKVERIFFLIKIGLSQLLAVGDSEKQV